MEVDLAQERLDVAPLVARQVLAGEPAAAGASEQIRVRARRHQVPRQDRMHSVLQPGPLLHQICPLGDQTAAAAGPVVGHPRLRQEIRRQQLRKDAGIHLVGLDLRLRYRPGLARVA